MSGAACGHVQGQGEEGEEEARLCACCKTEVGVKMCSGCHRCLIDDMNSDNTAWSCSAVCGIVLACVCKACIYVACGHVGVCWCEVACAQQTAIEFGGSCGRKCTDA